MQNAKNYSNEAKCSSREAEKGWSLAQGPKRVHQEINTEKSDLKRTQSESTDQLACLSRKSQIALRNGRVAEIERGQIKRRPN